MARAMARRYSACDDKLIISEVNWPILGTGVYSPVGAPYESTGVRHNDPSVSEEDYASFMIRYVAIAISSGMVERVYWWRMIAHGFGLVDDIDLSDLRKRPAYDVFKTFMEILGDSVFIERILADQADNVYVFKYKTADDQNICLAWVNGDDIEVELPFACSALRTLTGTATEMGGNKVLLTGAPQYLFPL